MHDTFPLPNQLWLLCTSLGTCQASALLPVTCSQIPGMEPSGDARIKIRAGNKEQKKIKPCREECC